MFSVALLLLLAAGCVKCEQLTQPASVTVQPGQRLTITCQVSYSLGSYYTAWIRQPAGKGLEWIGMRYTGGSHYKDSLKNKFSIDLDSSSKTVTLNGQNVQPEDTAVYYCARAYSGGYFDYWGKGTMVTITSGTPKSPTVFPLMQCGSGTGNTVTLGCFATDFTPSSLTYAWTKNGAALTNSIQYPPVQTGNFYTGISQIQVSKQDWDGKQSFQCAVTHAGGNPPAVTFQRPVEIYMSPTLSVLASSDEENQASFSCFAKDFSPKSYKFKWLKDDADITNKIDEIVTPSKERQLENGTKVYSAASFLLVKASEWTPTTTFTCLFEGKGENNLPVFVNSSVIHDNQGTSPAGGECPEADVEITIIGPTMEDMFLNRKGKLECQAQENKPTITEMKFENEQGKDLLGSGMVKGNKNTYSISIDISYEEWSRGIKRTCVVTHSENYDPLKKVYERSFGGKLQRPSVFMMPPVEHTRKETVTLTCFVKDFSPKEVYVSWLVDDDAADSDKTVQTTNPIENSGSYSAYGQLTVSLEQWKQNDKVYSCVVYHESVANTTRAIVRSIGYRTLGNTNLVNLNMNVPDTCKQ